jgi:hypothetical protein
MKMTEIENVPLSEKIRNDKVTPVKVKILKYFCLNGNILSIPGWIADSFSQPLHVGNTVKQCKELCKSGLLKSESIYAKGYGGGYKRAYQLNLTFENLEYLNSKLPIEDIVHLMKTPDFVKLLPDINRYFENNLQNQGFSFVNSEVKSIVEKNLKLSPTCLKFVFNKEGYLRAAKQQENLVSKSQNIGISGPEQKKK